MSGMTKAASSAIAEYLEAEVIVVHVVRHRQPCRRRFGAHLDPGNDRLSCVFCIMASKGDMRNGAEHQPTLLDQYAALEERTGYTMHMSRIPIRQMAA